MSWGTDDAIYLNALSGIQRVPAAGGAPTVVTTIREGDTGQQFPVLLPDGKGLLFRGNSQMYVQSLQTGRRQALGAGVAVDYLPTGHLIYVQAGTVFAVPFDPVRLETTGAPVAVLQGVAQTPTGAAQFSASRAGSIAYVPAGTDTPSMTLVWVDRAGVEQPVGISGAAYAIPRLAPDGRRLAVVHGGSVNTGGGDVWLHDLTRETSSRVTVDGGGFPAWTPDGRQLAFNKAGLEDVYVRSFDGSGREDRFLTGVSGGSRPMSWSPDGRFLVYVAVNPTTASDIMVVDRQDPTTSRPFLQTRFREGAPIFSADGKWIAYVSDNSGRTEIYMRPFPGPGEELTISTGGGVEPAWARNTGELFYRQGDAMMSVDVKTTPTLVVGKPRRLFERRYERVGGVFANYDVTPDGRRLLLIKGSAPQEGATQINVVLNWVDELKRLTPAGGDFNGTLPRPLLADLVEAGPGELVRDHDCVELTSALKFRKRGSAIEGILEASEIDSTMKIDPRRPPYSVKSTASGLISARTFWMTCRPCRIERRVLKASCGNFAWMSMRMRLS